MMNMKVNPQNMKKVIDDLRRQRDEEIRGLYKSYRENPRTGWTINKIADEYGISKQRVWQIVEDLKKENE